jgi:hypothetical protein
MSNKIRTICVSRRPWSTLRDHLDAVAKLVGVSDDFERLAACEPVARIALEDRVSIALAGQRDVATARMVVAPTQFEMRRSRQPSETPTKPAERARNGAELEIADWHGHRLNVRRITAMDANHHNRCFSRRWTAGSRFPCRSSPRLALAAALQPLDRPGTEE